MKINPVLIPSCKAASAYLSAAINGLPNGIIKFTGINSNTTSLTLTSDGGIKIGKGINHVIVSAGIFFQFSGATNYLYTRLTKGTSEISTVISPYSSASSYASNIHSSKMIPVAENDVIYLRGLEAKNGTIRAYGNTWLTVQVLD